MAAPEAELARALEGDPAAVRALVGAFTPVIQARASRALSRRGGAQGRDTRQELADLVQEVFLVLFRDDARALRAWHPEKGLSLLNFVGLVAQREVVRIARSGRRSPWALDPWEDAALEEAAGGVETIEQSTASRELFDRVYEELEEELHPRGMELFRMLVIEEASVPDTCAHTGMTPEAVYNWRSRLAKRARAILERIEAIGSVARGPIPSEGSRA